MTSESTYRLTNGHTVTSGFVRVMMRRLEAVMQHEQHGIAAMQLVEHCQDPSKPITAPARDVLRKAYLIDGHGKVVDENDREFILMASKGTSGLDTSFIDPFI